MLDRFHPNREFAPNFQEEFLPSLIVKTAAFEKLIPNCAGHQSRDRAGGPRQEGGDTCASVAPYPRHWRVQIA